MSVHCALRPTLMCICGCVHMETAIGRNHILDVLVYRESPVRMVSFFLYSHYATGLQWDT